MQMYDTASDSKRVNGYSTGTAFYKALADAIVKRNENAREDIESIKRFINARTGFHVSAVSLREGRDLIIKCRAKGGE